MKGKVNIIAEAACTWHIGKSAKQHLANALECIHVAQEAGADVCKFQFTSDPAKMARRRHVADLANYNRLAWPVKWLPVLAAECEDVGIEFMCSAYLPQDAATIAPFVKRFKIASLEAMDLQLFEACKQHGKPIILSCGAMSDEDMDGLVSSVRSCWFERDVTLLHCVAAYPAPINQMNLGVLRYWPGAPFIGLGGLSDHSGDVLTGAIAVAAGAMMIEFHLRLNTTSIDNPDYVHSLPPAKARAYVANIRKAELMLGDGLKKIEPCERPILRHRVVA